MLFPEGLQYSNDKDRELIKLMDSCHSSGIQANQAWWSQAMLDTRFEAGDQSVWKEVYKLTRTQQNPICFNRIRRVVSMIGGHQRLNRKSTTIIPVENADQQTADQFTKIFMWLDQSLGLSHTISDSFHGSLVTGMNLLQVWVDYRDDPISGSIRVDNCAFNSFMIDPFFRKHDLSDCNYIWKRNYLTKAECISLLPDKAVELEISSPQSGGRDMLFNFMPENYQLDTNKLLAYDEFYYRAYRKQKVLIDTETGETLEWKSNDNDALKRFVDQYSQVEIADTIIPTVRLAIVVQGRVMYDDINPLGIDTYPFVPVLTYYNPQLQSYSLRLQGVVRGLRDAQYLYNRRKLIELDTLESQVNSGFIYKEDALINTDDVFMPGNGRGIGLKATAQMTDVQKIPPGDIPPAVMELSRSLGKEIEEISGVSEELLGAASDDVAGVLSMLRQGAGLVTLQGLFDRLDYSQKLLGKVLLKVIQNNFTPGKIKRIIEQEPSPQFYNKYYGIYDAQVAAGVATENQKQMSLVQALNLRKAGVQIPDQFLIENMVIQNKTEVIEMMQKQQQEAQQQAQQQQQIQQQELEAQAGLSQARIQEQLALAQERSTRSMSNLGLYTERIHEAHKDDTQAKLNYIKALSELEDMDLAKIEKLIQMAKMVEEPAMTTSPVKDIPMTPKGGDNTAKPL